MTPEQFREVRERFEEALELPRAQRAQLVERLCAQEPVVGKKVQALLAADEQDEGFLEAPAVGAAPETVLRRLAGDSLSLRTAVTARPDAPARDAEPGPPQPRDFGPYLLLEQLGRGGMGVVYRARHRQTGQLAALKTVVGASEAVLSSIRREIRALARLRHPGIVRILDEGVEGGLPWYAMELVEGMSLGEHAEQLRGRPGRGERPTPPHVAGSTVTVAPDTSAWSETWSAALVGQTQLDVWSSTEALSELAPGPAEMPSAVATEALSGKALGRVLGLVRRLSLALAYLHGEGIVHRDLKPGNVMVRPAVPGGPGVSAVSIGMPVIVDFGLAADWPLAKLSQVSGAELESRETLEISALAAGTVAYMAPEQKAGEMVDARADLYALGAILFELLTGQRLFGSMALRLQSLAAKELPEGWDLRLPARVRPLLRGLLAHKPQHRIGYASAVAEALLELGADEGLELPAPPARAYLYRPRFIGRQEPLRQLEQALAKAEAGHGALVLLQGESGAGKTRLAMELCARASKRKVEVLVGECGARRIGETIAPTEVLQALRGPLKSLADRCREGGKAETMRLLGDGAKLLGQFEPLLKELPGVEALPEPTELPPSAARLRLYDALSQTLFALAVGSTVVLVLDDLQWADELTMGFVVHLVETGALEKRRVLLVATVRSEEAPESLVELGKKPGVHDLRLERLEGTEIGAMVQEMLALPEAPGAFVGFLAGKSEGNPLFIAEYLRAAVGEGLLWRDPQGAWQVPDPAGANPAGANPAGANPAGAVETQDFASLLPLPASLRELIGRRLESLSALSLQMVQAAAVLGREVDEELLLQMTRLGGLQTMDAIGELVARQILEQDGAGRLRFVHDKIREVSYQRIGSGARPALHRAAAVAMDGQPEAQRKRYLAALGHHWEQAGEPLPARRAYLAGASAAKTGAALSEAEHLYRAYLRLATEPDQESADALNDFGVSVLHPQGRNDEAKEAFQKALETARALGFRKTEAACLRNLSIICRLTRNLAEACTLLEKALEIQRELGETAAIARTLDVLATTKSQQNAREEAHALYTEALALTIETGDPAAEGITRCNLGILESDLAHWAESQAHFERSVLLLRQSGNSRLEAAAMSNFANLFRRRGQMSEAEAAYRQAMELQRSIGDRRNEAYSLCNLANLYENQGRWIEARPLYQRALAFGQETGELRISVIALHGLAFVEVAEGAFEEAQQHLEESLIHARTLGEPNFEAEGLLFLSRAKRLGGADLAEVEGLLQEAARLMREAGTAEQLVYMCLERTHLLLAAGQSAEDSVQRAQEQLRSLGLLPDSEMALKVACLVREQAAFAAGEHHRLYRGELFENLPEGLRRRLTEARSASGH